MTSASSRISRRSVLEGIGVGALGIASAALLGCGGDGGGSDPVAQLQQGAAESVGSGLPLVAPVAQGTRVPGGKFTQAATETYVLHDHHAQGGNTLHSIIGDQALEADPVTAKVRPHALTSWEIADNGTTLVFKLRPDLFIHNMAPWNGRQFTAEDVAWNWERSAGFYAEREKIQLSRFVRATNLLNMVKAEAVDPLTVKVTLSAPNSSFFNGLADQRLLLMPKEMADIGFDDPLKMGGIGAFQITEFIKDQRMSFKKHPRFWRPNEPHFDVYDTIVVPDRAATVAAFASGQIQWYGKTMAWDEITLVKSRQPDALLYTWIDQNWGYMRPAMSYEPFKDFRVRKAFSLAIDYQAIADGTYGAGWAYTASVHPGFPEGWKPGKVRTLPGYNPDTKAQDRAEAHRLLTAAGYPNGKGLDFDVLFSSSAPEEAVFFQSKMMAEFTDLKLKLRPTDGAAFNSDITASRFTASTGTITASPDAVLDMSQNYRTGGSRNYGRFSNPDLDMVLGKATVELNSEARIRIMDEFQQRFMTEWMPNWHLCAKPARHMVQANVSGMETLAGTWWGSAEKTKVSRLFYVKK